MSAAEYDMEDPDIRDMVYRGHVPDEVFLFNVNGQIINHQILCDRCRRRWPCPPRVQLRIWGKDSAPTTRGS